MTILTLYAAVLTNSGVSANSTELPSQYPLVYVYPELVTAEVGENITVSVVVYNLTDSLATDPDNPQSKVPLGNLYGFDIQFSWDPTVIKYVNHTVTTPVEKYPSPVPPSPYAGILHGFGAPSNESIYEFKNVVNETGNIPGAADPRVRAWFAYSTQLPATPFNGNGTIFTMTFQVLKQGESPLEIVYCILSDNSGKPIALGQSGTWLNPPRNGIFRTAGTPVADFSYWPEIGVTNKPVYFQATVTENASNIVTYAWDFGDGTKKNTTQPATQYSYTASGTYIVSLYVVDQNDIKSATKTKQVQIVNTRNLKVKSLTLNPPQYLRPNMTLTIDSTIENSGETTENCTAKIYYNTTNVDPANPTAATWIFIANQTLQIPKEQEKKLTFSVNSSLLPTLESHYHFLINATGIPAGYESDTTDNLALSNPIFYTEQIIHVPSITSFAAGYDRKGTLVQPVIQGEKTKIMVEVKNDGNERAIYNVTLYVNDTIFSSNQTSELIPGDPEECKETLEWEHSFETGYFNLTVTVEIGNITAAQTKGLRVIKPPTLVITYNPEEPTTNQIVTLNATESTHQDPDGNITQWTWRIFAPGVDVSGTPTTTLSGKVVQYNFTQAGNWTIILRVQDSFGISYDSERASTNAYTKELILKVFGEEQEEQPAPFPWEMILVVIVVALVIVVAAILAMRKRKVTVEEE